MIRTLAIALFVAMTVTAVASAKDGDTVDTDSYFVFGDSTTSWTYRIDTVSFTDRFLTAERSVSGRSYKVRVRTYESGASDTTLYRRSEIGVHHVVPASGILAESLTLPRYVHLDQEWFERDSSWSYRVIRTAGTLKTPADRYTDVIVVRAASRMNGIAGTLPSYDLYFVANRGLVAVGIGTKMVAYLSGMTE